MGYSAVFLDFDDTLVDTAQNTYDTVKDVYNDYELGRYFDSFEDYFYNYFQPNNARIWHKYEQETITKDELIYQRFVNTFSHIEDMTEKRALDLNEDYLQRIVRKEKLIPGATDILDYLQAKYPLFMVSNGFADMQYTKLNTVGFGKYFKGVILSDEIGISKPNPGIYKAALEEARETSGKVIMIGDNYLTDVTGARNSGIDQVWYNPKQSLNSDFEPTFVVQRLEDIKRIL